MIGENDSFLILNVFVNQRYYHRQGKGIVDKYRKLAVNKYGNIFFSKE